MELKICNMTGWMRYHLPDDRCPHRCHIRRGFIFLIILIFLLSLVLYISYTSHMLPSTSDPNALYKKLVIQIRSYYEGIPFEFSFADQTQNQTHNQTQQMSTTQNTPTVNSVHYHLAHPYNYQFIMDEPEKCLHQNPFLVLMVPVAPNQLKARNAIRSTWGNETTVRGKTVLTLFIVGLRDGPSSNETQQQLQEESRQHGDLLQSNFMDSYVNLTIKTMVIMDWLATRCPQASFAMKVDSDMFLNLENLMSLLLAPETPKQNYITGMVMRDRPVVRDTNSKWYVPKELYPEPHYPAYLLGMGYVFSNDLPPKIVEASKEIKPFNIEDAYVGACLKRLEVQPSMPPVPSQFRAYLNKYNRDEFLKVITTILNSPQQLLDFWKDVKRSA
ncbi:beta-1,3-galactosyltransferase 1-like [Misgurnus anguillicaudatus]|uniref:beta-1,3-galactosyltransferase 1-like n=1 Tax=Misgurnus anguillicaudatus TaxID=75329 RepID=UPI003CCF4959